MVAVDGKITAVGKQKDIDSEGATLVIDAKGTTLAPGLIDSHVHPVAGDWTPRQNQIGWIDSYLHGGVTSMISAGEVHTPGRPKDVVGLKAMAIFAQRAFSAFRPGGVRIHAGAPVIEHGMVEEDFKDLAAAGVTMLGEVGLGSVKDGATARQMVSWARKFGIQSTIHTGGPSIPGSSLIDKDIVLAADADVIGHINGGHTALPDSSTRRPRGRSTTTPSRSRPTPVCAATKAQLDALPKAFESPDNVARAEVVAQSNVLLRAMVAQLATFAPTQDRDGRHDPGVARRLVHLHRRPRGLRLPAAHRRRPPGSTSPPRARRPSRSASRSTASPT